VSIAGIFYALRSHKMTNKKRFSPWSGAKKSSKNSLSLSKMRPLNALFLLTKVGLTPMSVEIIAALREAKKSPVKSQENATLGTVSW
jgi:hypothetical protein